jgi:hypothetical protein
LKLARKKNARFWRGLRRVCAFLVGDDPQAIHDAGYTSRRPGESWKRSFALKLHDLLFQAGKVRVTSLSLTAARSAEGDLS